MFFSLEVDFFASSQWEGNVALRGTGILSFSDSFVSQQTNCSATSHLRTSIRNTEHEIKQGYLARRYLQALMSR